MIHIKDILAKSLENASKAKFYRTNRDVFLKYFDSVQQYEALIAAWNFEKLEGIIKSGNYPLTTSSNILDAK